MGLSFSAAACMFSRPNTILRSRLICIQSIIKSQSQQDLDHTEDAFVFGPRKVPLATGEAVRDIPCRERKKATHRMRGMTGRRPRACLVRR